MVIEDVLIAAELIVLSHKLKPTLSTIPTVAMLLQHPSEALLLSDYIIIS